MVPLAQGGGLDAMNDGADLAPRVERLGAYAVTMAELHISACASLAICEVCAPEICVLG